MGSLSSSAHVVVPGRRSACDRPRGFLGSGLRAPSRLPPPAQERGEGTQRLEQGRGQELTVVAHEEAILGPDRRRPEFPRATEKQLEQCCVPERLPCEVEVKGAPAPGYDELSDTLEDRKGRVALQRLPPRVLHGSILDAVLRKELLREFAASSAGPVITPLDALRHGRFSCGSVNPVSWPTHGRESGCPASLDAGRKLRTTSLRGKGR